MMILRRLAWALLLCSLNLAVGEAAEPQYSGKLVLRTGAGQFSNQGTQSGGSASVGGFNLQYYHFLNSFLAVGLGYQAQFDISNGTVPISGYEIGGRVYWGDGTKVSEGANWGAMQFQRSSSFYFTSCYGKRQFYLGEDLQSTDPSKQLAGEYGVINAGVGWDYRLDKNFEINTELNTSLFALSSTDSRVRISETFLWIGLGYVF